MKPGGSANLYRGRGDWAPPVIAITREIGSHGSGIAAQVAAVRSIEDVEQIARGASQAVQARDHERVAGLEPVDHLPQLSAVAARATRF
jgi:hypothetical protein